MTADFAGLYLAFQPQRDPTLTVTLPLGRVPTRDAPLQPAVPGEGIQCHDSPRMHREFSRSCSGERFARFLILTFFTLVACAPQEPAPEPPATARQPMNEHSTAAPLVSSLQVETLEDSVRFTYMVTNTSGSPIELTFPTGQSFDFVVLDNGREVWRWSEDMMFTQAIRSETLRPDETRTYHAVWTPARSVRGNYTVRGFLTAQEHRAEQQAEVQLP